MSAKLGAISYVVIVFTAYISSSLIQRYKQRRNHNEK